MDSAFWSSAVQLPWRWLLARSCLQSRRGCGSGDSLTRLDVCASAVARCLGLADTNIVVLREEEQCAGLRVSDHVN